MTPPKVEAQDLIDILKQQVGNALYEAALNAAISKGLQRQVEELEAKVKELENIAKGLQKQVEELEAKVKALSEDLKKDV